MATKSAQQKKTNLPEIYIQYSKRVTKWAMILSAAGFTLTALGVALLGLQQYEVTALTTLFTTYSTALGVIIAAYQGNSMLEKYTDSKKIISEAFKNNIENENETSNG